MRPRLGLMVDDLSPSHLSWALVNSANALARSGRADVCIFYEDLVKPTVRPELAVLPAVHATGFEGVLVATGLHTAARLAKLPAPARKLFYCWDLEWQRMGRRTTPGWPPCTARPPTSWWPGRSSTPGCCRSSGTGRWSTWSPRRTPGAYWGWALTGELKNFLYSPQGKEYLDEKYNRAEKSVREIADLLGTHAMAVVRAMDSPRAGPAGPGGGPEDGPPEGAGRAADAGPPDRGDQARRLPPGSGGPGRTAGTTGAPSPPGPASGGAG
jgi:hypothetical protein